MENDDGNQLCKLDILSLWIGGMSTKIKDDKLTKDCDLRTFSSQKLFMSFAELEVESGFSSPLSFHFLHPVLQHLFFLNIEVRAEKSLLTVFLKHWTPQLGIRLLTLPTIIKIILD